MTEQPAEEEHTLRRSCTKHEEAMFFLQELFLTHMGEDSFSLQG